MTRLRFPRTARLQRSSDFREVRAKGRSEHGRLMVCSFVVAEGESARSRVGFITSRRVGSAVIRNRVRRHLREIVRTQQALLRPGCWIVIVARQAAAGASQAELQAEWLRLAKRARLIVVDTGEPRTAPLPDAPID